MEIDRQFQMVALHRQNPEKFHRRCEVGTRLGYYFGVGMLAVRIPPFHSGGSCHAAPNIATPIESESEHLWQTFGSGSVLVPNLGVGAKLKTIEYCF